MGVCIFLWYNIFANAKSPSPSDSSPAPFVDYNGHPASACIDDHGSFRLFVSNLDPALSRMDLEAAFEAFAPVRMLNFSPTFAIVAVEGQERAEDAVRMINGAPVGDRNVKVKSNIVLLWIAKKNREDLIHSTRT
jgi:hypothetical protein